MQQKLLLLTLLGACSACGGGGNATGSTPAVTVTASPTPSGTNAPAAYAAAYQAVKWGPNVSVSFSGSCSMTFTTNGQPFEKPSYFLAPAMGSQTVVAHTPVSNMPMTLVPAATTSTSAAVTIDTCPSKASATTSTNLGPIGYTIYGEAIFNAYEATGTAALSDNVSYSFTSNGTPETASFIDSCNSHSAGLNGSALWHYHGVPNCLTQQLDGNGPSHILGFALDGFPIYGGRDINGNVISVSQLDACNGITSPTPEFPNGAYHYVLPIGVTGAQSSLHCYAGTPVSSH